MSTVSVIGAGSSGIVAALKASEKNNVILLDGNDKTCKKILLTGNGRCNYWNSNLTSDMYETDSKDSLSSVLKSYSEEVLYYLEKQGLYPKIKNGYYYPYSNQASSVREIFDSKIKGKIRFISGFKVIDITEKDGKYFLLSSNGEKVVCDKVIIATGSKAYPKTGSDGSGYRFAKEFGHSINNVLPALTGIIAEGKFLKDWEKIRCDAKVSLNVNGKEVKADEGEIQLTNSGISGICTFNISGEAARNLYLNNDVWVHINFMPYIENGFYNWFTKRCDMLKDATIEQALESIFNYKLMFVLLKQAGVSKDALWSDLNEKSKQALSNIVERFPLKVIDVESFEKSQVCTGGVPLAEINAETMESLKKPGVYFCGEILDVDGRCGGYNLAFAFISGYIAGRSV